VLCLPRASGRAFHAAPSTALDGRHLQGLYLVLKGQREKGTLQQASGTQEQLQQARMEEQARLDACEAAMQSLLRDVEGGGMPQGEAFAHVQDVLAEVPLDAGGQHLAVASCCVLRTILKHVPDNPGISYLPGKPVYSC
jgi:hypothetical protein